MDIHNLYMKLFKQKLQTINEIINQSLWLNEYIKINKRYVYIKNWENKGIRKISDIIHNSRKLLTHEELKTNYNMETKFLQTIQINKSIKISNLIQFRRSADNKIKVNKIYK